MRGEVRAEALTHRVKRFNDLRAVVLQGVGRPDLPLELERWRVDAKSLLLKFAGIDAPEQARSTLVGGYVTIAPDQRDPLPEGTHYIDDIVDCAVVTPEGQPLGRIVEVVSMPSTDAYVVRGGQRRSPRAGRRRLCRGHRAGSGRHTGALKSYSSHENRHRNSFSGFFCLAVGDQRDGPRYG